uniref:Uncharacterized protein n=1 Tax=Meloidogyne incognita TaxID=6306 RepID=A0A914KLI3_MELIC
MLHFLAKFYSTASIQPTSTQQHQLNQLQLNSINSTNYFNSTASTQPTSTQQHQLNQLQLNSINSTNYFNSATSSFNNNFNSTTSYTEDNADFGGRQIELIAAELVIILAETVWNLLW